VGPPKKSKKVFLFLDISKSMIIIPEYNRKENMKYCQGPKCHTYFTKDRLRGPKGNKVYQTRRRTSFYYGNGNMCSTRCQDDWFNQFGDQAIDHFGRTTQPIQLTEDNAWVKDYDYDWNGGDYRRHNFKFINKITNEERNITEQQYDDRNYTINAV